MYGKQSDRSPYKKRCSKVLKLTIENNLALYKVEENDVKDRELLKDEE